MSVRDVIRLIEGDGWRLVATRGSHRQCKHATKLGRVTIAEKLSDDEGLVRSPASSSRQDSERPGMRYAIVIERADSNYSAYAPDLPGCVATGETVVEVEREMREAIRFHLDGMVEDGLEPPSPSSVVEYVDA